MSGQASDQESVRSSSDSLSRYCIQQLRQPIAEHGLSDRALVLFLDTFEQVQSVRVYGRPGSSGEAASSKIAAWIEDLAASAGLAGLKVVVSGRAALEPGSALKDHVVESLHLEDLVRSLAHPGLALRLVSWRLIRDVLAEPCQLGSISESEARTLLDGLADEVWLVDRRPTPTGLVLEHRRDIRGLMVRLMTADEGGGAEAGSTAAGIRRGLSRRVAEVHRKAAEYHAKGVDPDLDAGAARAEMAYHRLMLGSDDGVDEDIRQAGLGDDIELLPDRVRAHAKVVLGMSLDAREEGAASEDDWRVGSLREGSSRLYENDDPLAALDVLARRKPVHPGERPAWYLRSLDAAARWNDADPAELDAIEGTLGPDSKGPKEASGVETLAASSRFDPKARRALAEDLLDRAAALSLIRFKRGEYARAFETSLRFLESLLTWSLFSYDSAAWRARICNLTYARLAWAARPRRFRGRAHHLQRWNAVRAGTDEAPNRGDAGLNSEIQRFVALTYQAGRPLPREIWVTTRTFVPDPQWLSDLLAYEESRARRRKGSGSSIVVDLRAFIETDTRAAAGGTATSGEIRGALAVTFSRMYESRGIALVDRHPMPGFDPRLLRFDRKEFRPSARHALLAAFPGPVDVHRLAELAWGLLPWKPSDLSPACLAGTQPKDAVTRLVDYVDSSHRLHELLDAASRERPAADGLRRTVTAIADWERAIKVCTSSR